MKINLSSSKVLVQSLFSGCLIYRDPPTLSSLASLTFDNERTVMALVQYPDNAAVLIFHFTREDTRKRDKENREKPCGPILRHF